jgi:hypothetical protein
VRVYIPVTLAMLQGLVADGLLHARSGTAFAVTPKLRESYAEGDDDELAEVALREAALASLRLLAIEGSGGQERSDPGIDSGAGERSDSGSGNESGLPVRRAVLVADVADAADRPDLDDAVVRLVGPVEMSDVIAVYVDNSTAEQAVAAAVEVIDDADLGDEDAELTVGDAQDHDLAWYATQELAFLLELL